MSLREAIVDALRQPSIEKAMDELALRILRDSEIITAADRMAVASHNYMVAHVKKGPANCCVEAEELVKATHAYRQTRPNVDFTKL